MIRPYRTSSKQKLTISEVDDGRFVVKGNLTFASIDKDILKSFSFLKGEKNIILDLSQVHTTDSAGLALMIEWLKYCKKNTMELHFENIPLQLLALAKLSGFDHNMVMTVVKSVPDTNPELEEQNHAH
jgi:phospholipid transport system transporter-binding protein